MGATAKRLWEVTDELAEVGALIAEAGGELTPELEERLARSEGAFESKVESVALFIRHSELEADNAKAEKERLAAIQKHHENAVRGLRTYLLRCLSTAGVQKVETHRARVRIQKSGTPSIQYGGDLGVLPPSFVRVVPETRELDKKAITEALRAGEELPEGIQVSYSNSVRIS